MGSPAPLTGPLRGVPVRGSLPSRVRSAPHGPVGGGATLTGPFEPREGRSESISEYEFIEEIYYRPPPPCGGGRTIINFFDKDYIQS